MPESTDRPPRVLLSGVFGPFGVDDAYGRKENIMELFHNQVTRGQSWTSFRFFHRSFGLYFIAENIDADVTVLDFPSRRRFIHELSRGYDYVGISFIAPNMVKAREMARLTRRHSPEATIVLGGHGAAIEGVEQLIDCDHVVRGEGIGAMRRILGDNPCAPMRHPTLPSAEAEAIAGVPVPAPYAGLLVPGVGCVNGCKFCSTTHFFGKAYTPFIRSGDQLFRLACRLADERGTDDFFVMDENFLKDRKRALELIEQMERHNRFFRFHLFSSAEAITAFGLDNLVRLGANFVWIGVESSNPQGNYAKNAGIDAKELVRRMRDRGLTVLASGILCAEHHTQSNIQAEIDYMTDLRADFVQFMLLTPLPVTALYRDHQRRGVLRDDLPLEEWHGQKMLAYRHPHFPGDSAQRWIDRAFRQEYERNCSSLYRVTDTAYRGFRRLAARDDLDPCLASRRQTLRDRMRQYGLAMYGLSKLADTATERKMAAQLDRNIQKLDGVWTVKERAMRLGAAGLMGKWKARVKLLGDKVQPKTIVTRYPADRRAANTNPLVLSPPEETTTGLPDLQAAARSPL